MLSDSRCLGQHICQFPSVNNEVSMITLNLYVDLSNGLSFHSGCNSKQSQDFKHSAPISYQLHRNFFSIQRIGTSLRSKWKSVLTVPSLRLKELCAREIIENFSRSNRYDVLGVCKINQP